MSGFFNMDNGFFRALGKLADLMILNLLFIVCSIPIVTIGASTTAMYYVTLKMAENEEGYIARAFWKSFKLNFRQATIIWLIMLIVGIILILDLLIMREATGTAMNVMRIALIATTILYLILFTYVFPMLARFDNTVKNTLRNALIMAIADFPRTIVIFIISVGAVLITFLNGYTIWYGLLVWILAGFALVALANSYFFKKIFAKYIPKDESAEEENPDEWLVDEMPETLFDAKDPGSDMKDNDSSTVNAGSDAEDNDSSTVNTGSDAEDSGADA